MKLDKIQKADYRFVPANADADFSPEHNIYVIEKTIREYEANMKKKKQIASDNVRERAGALSVYLKGLEKGRTNSNMIKFFGKKEIARLRGDEVRNRLDELRVLSKDGKLLRKVPR